MKLIGKLQDGTVFLKKGHDGDEQPFEFQTDEGSKLYLGIEFGSSWLQYFLLTFSRYM